MEKIKTAVIGVGYLGKFHAEKYANLAASELIAVADINKSTAQEIASKYNAQAVENYQDLLGKVDAVSIVVPTPHHYTVAKDFLSKGCHVLLEKPITTTIAEAEELINIAKENKCILQVGHIERFNPAILGIEQALNNPRFIESNRIAPFKPRNTDVNVVLDLMIHDIDIIMELVDSNLKSIQANGIPILSKEIDIANARLVFENGCVANVTASRVSMKTERKMRIFQQDAYITVDFHQRISRIHKKGMNIEKNIPEFITEEHAYEATDALKDEIDDFLQSIMHNKPPKVSGEDGKRALETALEITTLMQNNNL